MITTTKPSADEAPPLSEALERTVNSFVDVLDKRLELAQLDARALASRLVQAAVFLLGGVFFAAVGWAALMGLAYVVLQRWYSPAIAVGAIFLVNAIFGLVLLALGRRQLSPPKQTS
jgi:uncharacterized membrane protein YqjE